MGVHSGLAYQRGDDYVAFAVHQAARVVSAANGGQVVVSEQASELARAVPGVALIPVGRFRLRDFDEPVRL
jgi:class 3 adenylate cyclase